MPQTPKPRPTFITFTGVDRAQILPDLRSLSARYPIEWGILIDPEQEDSELFPTLEHRVQVQSSDLRLSAHVCGAAAVAIAAGERADDLNLSGFSRLQLNHSRQGSTEQQITNSLQFAVRKGIRLALQCQGQFPIDPRADWLYDISFGLGTRPSHWPPLALSSGLCGYSGGISPTTVTSTLAALPLTEADDGRFWLDMESGVRTHGRLDLRKCEQVCQLVFDS